MHLDMAIEAHYDIFSGSSESVTWTWNRDSHQWPKKLSKCNLKSIVNSGINLTIDTFTVNIDEEAYFDEEEITNDLKKFKVTKISHLENYGDESADLLGKLIKNYAVEHFERYRTPGLIISSTSLKKVNVSTFDAETEDFSRFLQSCLAPDITIREDYLFLHHIQMLLKSWAANTRHIKHIDFYTDISEGEMEETGHSISKNNDEIRLTLGPGWFTLSKNDGRTIKITHAKAPNKSKIIEI